MTALHILVILAVFLWVRDVQAWRHHRRTCLRALPKVDRKIIRGEQ